MEKKILKNDHTKMIDYVQVMEKMGIDTSKFVEYEDAEKFARHFTKVTIQKHVQVAFSNTTFGISI